nr:MAG TPA: RNAseH-like protein [Caudoviricetes sp.]DAW52536.1 MAG TPA: RNAseH-like protein [Bacteriophage sp.]
MLRIRIAAFRGRPLNGDGYSNIQRMEINGGVQPTPSPQ